ncbi:GTPase family protein [Paeniglutamicibacter cryotolerans]|uniref:GTP-binding protein EngB required for normal cell division n=1 Tax=Paeniglutamicibacter cryotolerans TaxID=670079 RepID=A0A839QRN6_9MICC|nr:GTPase [Paeniglutamicibacter cryotolerans]MBB2997444.1 GTP-binding protein EngB required for normal cell division [Paeniglutamicibacter cryotolerans]
MSRRRREAPDTPLVQRLEALEAAHALGEGRIAEVDADAVLELLERASTRRSLSGEHTVVGFFGATGSGKSSLFNAVAGAELARVGVIRPTTSEARAAIWGPIGSEPILDWLRVAQRHVIADPLLLRKGGFFGGDREVGGLILLDLPDFDSTAAEHRETAQRLAGQVDVLVWVLDPQKYADAAIHRGFIAPLASHGAVTLVALNQIDRLRDHQRQPVLDSLADILAADGLDGVRVIPTSTTTGNGIDVLRSTIAAVTAERTASTARLLADVGDSAARIGRGVADPPVLHTAPGTGAEKLLASELGEAAGIGTVTDAVAKSYRMDAAARTGWPVTRWLGRIRPDPLRRLNLKAAGVNPEVNRTSLPAPGAAANARRDATVRGYADAAARTAPEAWAPAIRAAARSHARSLPGDLDRAIAGTPIGAGRGSWWWPVASVIQWLSLLAALGGALWLGAYAVAGFLQVKLPDVPAVQGFPVPTLMLVGGVLLGIMLGILTGFAARISAAARARAAHKKLEASIGLVALQDIILPVKEEIERLNEFQQAVARARG